MTSGEAHLEGQYQRLAAKYYLAQANFHNAQQEYQRLLTVVLAKNEVICLLLPYYPHPITPELRYKIDLA